MARDQIPKDHIIQWLYTSLQFQTFVESCCQVPAIYPMAGELAGLVVNALDPGQSHPWHFDTNAFTVGLLTQKAEVGGAFEYSLNIRTASDENLDAVRDVLTDKDTASANRLEKFDSLELSNLADIYLLFCVV
ncbi:MAG: hypothetical protein ACRBCJ_12785 [Hyphomicrobiaceae bacterium]